jgi:Ca2+-binding RTX toxin-like protein
VRVRILVVGGVIAASLAASAQSAPPGAVNQRGDGWPRINGMLLMNDHDGHRPLDAQVGNDPFGGTDPAYRCNGRDRGGPCMRFFRECDQGGRCVREGLFHHELLGGHGNDTIFAGDGGDILWGDFKPFGPKGQKDKLTGGAGRDFIYGSPGRNIINAKGGNDFIKSRYGSGRIDCGPGRDIVYTSRRFRHRYRFRGCERITTGPSPGQGGTPTR